MNPPGSKSRLAVGQDQYCLMGLPFDAVSLSDATDIISKSIDQQIPCFLSTPNLNFTVMAQDDPDFYNSVIQSDLVVADGMPLIWVARFLNLPIYERVAGSDLFAFLSNQPRKKKIRVFFFGGEAGIAVKAHHELNESSQGMESCGFYDPGFVSIEEMSTEDIINHINGCEPDFIVVALGAKKGQRWIMHNRSRLNAPVISHLGAVINFVAGNVQRAPDKWQRYGFEWLWRIKQEPKLYKRYLGDGLRFIKMLVTQTLPLAVYSRRLVNKADIGNGQVFADTLPQQDKFTVRFKGSINTGQAIEFENVLQSALLSGKDVIINGAEIRYLSMSAIARLLTFQAQLEQKQNELLLKDFPAKIITLLRLSSVLQRFKLI
ncbi:MAG: acetylglucosaminyldiphospho-UDP acetyl-beta-D-mannosaminyltransferase [Methylophaga sp.]|jgi:N-acetylglucosaminyldiphosphoundecaprenol N-acetyl-beta-D-mannosaminyltransferase|uniref:WecB/TagA/CpsF family glycosyltransferase n=2 Tax=Methylophaga TaxID=40222 RepID=UPI000C9327B2|nr:WecB/TagA/CpsF family glycosyltransferase [Methylophaga sp. UBA2496]MAK67315.1 acetylglucosaminyldiphospho-UDP acetyl-beta-D-mannosaminyltransferase [Methylophaga sp.]MAY18352.1 acetylglucosaminyldiphospho-UDP acetyl-beta-D-mannosaminyltransferase [Methylophaga sp.]|tara:strand:+ start:68038 stop:69165 length:1128 start_codon:yes stop_codon:yes gene_type:complete